MAYKYTKRVVVSRYFGFLLYVLGIVVFFFERK